MVKTKSAGGLVSKTEFDSLGQAVKSFTTDGGGDTGWSHALNVTGDKVLEQSEIEYDDNGNTAPKEPAKKVIDPTDLVITIKTTSPEPGDLFRLESEAVLFKGIRQEVQRALGPSKSDLFPRSRPEETGVLRAERVWDTQIKSVEPSYVCYRRLFFEQRNSERYGWSMGPLQPFLSAGVFYADILRMPVDYLSANQRPRSAPFLGDDMSKQPLNYECPVPELPASGRCLEFDPGRLPRLSRLLALAIHLEGLVQSGKVADYAEIARLGHVTRARVSQIINLLQLAPDIQEEILFMPPTLDARDPIGLRQVQPIAMVLSWRKQRALWQALNDSAGCSSITIARRPDREVSPSHLDPPPPRRKSAARGPFPIG